MASSERLGSLIRMSRQRLKLKQQDLADAISVSRAHVSQLEIGTAGKPDEYELHLIAEALHEDENTLRELAGLPPLGEPSSTLTIPRHWGKRRREMLNKFMRFIETEIDEDEDGYDDWEDEDSEDIYSPPGYDEPLGG